MSALTLQNMSVRLGHYTALKDVSFTLKAGESVALVGPNGAGKTTLLRAALGLVDASGERRLDGTPIEQLPPEARARQAAYLPQDRGVAWSLLGGDLVALGRYAWGGGRAYDQLDADNRTVVDAALVKANATHLAERAVQTLSGGELARLHLARLLASSAPVLLADEPAAALDPRHQLDALAALKAEANSAKAVLVALHDLALAERMADRILVLDAGQLVADGPAATVLDEELLARVFKIRRRPEGGFDAAI
jgi:iron complex transport system ATP-binding protein